MKKILFVATALILLLTSSVFMQKNSNPRGIVSFVYCTTGNTDCEIANRVRNDKADAYTDGVDGVSAEFFAGGSRDLVFRLDKSTRTLRFDFREVSWAGDGESVLPAWWYSSPQQNVKPQMNVLGAYYAKEQCGGAATCNENYVTRINAGQWKVSGYTTTYALLWNPTARTDRPVNYPEKTSAVNVNYIKDSAGERFIITPLPNQDTSRYIAGLEAATSRTVSAAGQYVMPFTMTVRIK